MIIRDLPSELNSEPVCRQVGFELETLNQN